MNNLLAFNMKNPLLLVTFLSLIALLTACPNSKPTAADAQTQEIVTAATTFLDSLNPDQRGKAQLPFTPESTPTPAEFKGGQNGKQTFVGEQYGSAVWSNFPTSDVPRPGVTLGSLNDAQRAAALKVLQTILSPDGYRKIIDIMDSDQQLSESGTPYDDGNAFYTLGIFGTPSGEQPWMLQFGGHHLAINVVVAGANVAFTLTCTRKITPSGRRESTKMKIGDSSYEKDFYGRADRRDSARF